MIITCAQLNSTICDFSGNIQKIKKTLLQAQKHNSDLVILPELFLTGYPPLDLLTRKDFLTQTQNALDELLLHSKQFPKIGILCGTISVNNCSHGKGLYNSALLIQNNKILIKQHKTLLPTYDVFDEARYFDPAPDINTSQFKDEILGISICEDAWNVPEILVRNQYKCDPIQMLAKRGATLFINISSSPFQIGKEKLRYRLIQHHVLKHHKPFVFVNQIAGNDELIFDGRSFILDSQSQFISLFPSFREEINTINLKTDLFPIPYSPQDEIQSLYQALVLGIQDYMKKCNFKKAIVGLSGGIDSAVVCSLATNAIGSKNVVGVAMPSQFSSKTSVSDAASLAQNLNIKFLTIPITPIYKSYLDTFDPIFLKKKSDITEENIQARIRGNILMALSNKYGYLTLSTGNKSELSVGYCTLYGDMSGGLSVIGDVPKTYVYKIAEYINQNREIIPEAILKKPPSAELKPNQVDQDVLPPYKDLDRILELYINQGLPEKKIIQRGENPKRVRWIIQAIAKNEYKRRQSAPVLKVTSKAFGIGRRMPIAARY